MSHDISPGKCRALLVQYVGRIARPAMCRHRRIDTDVASICKFVTVAGQNLAVMNKRNQFTGLDP